MGILDDAIREHLELKRRAGASASEIQELEDELTAEPVRAGEEDGLAPPTAEESAPAPPADEPTGEGPIESTEHGLLDLDDPLTQEEIPSDAEPIVADDDSREQPISDDDSREQPITASTSEQEMTPAEQARVDYSDLDDTISHDTLAAAGETAEEKVTGGFADDISDDDFDLELELDDEPEHGAQGDELGAEALAGDDDDADSSLGAAGEEDELSSAETLEAPISDETGEELFELEDDEAGEEDSDDLLEETPDFLRETPEGDRLWFEQGAPKDFDFGDDD